MSKISRHLVGLASASAAVAGLVLLSPADAQSQSADRSIKIVLPEEPDTLDLCNSTRSAVGRVVYQNIGETLTLIEPKDGSITPRLAKSWERVDDDTWVFHLVEGASFSDGVPFTAETAIKGMQRTMESTLDCETRTKSLSDLKFTYKAIDDHTLEITTNKPEPILPTRIGILTIASPNTTWDQLVNNPVGTGPYVLDSYKPGDSIVLKYNANYWGAKPAVEQANYMWRTEPAVRAAMVKLGEADLSPNIAMQDATDPEMDFSYPNAETNYLRIESQMAPLDDVRVRQALALAIDRDAIRGSILPKDILIATQMVVPSIAGHNHEIDKQARMYDPEKAKALLAEAKKDGVPVDRHIQMIGRTNQWENATETVEAIHSMWQAVGFNVSLKMVPVSEWVEFNIHPYKGVAASAGETKVADRDPIILQHMHDNNNGDPVFSMYNKYACGAAASPHCWKDVDDLIAKATIQSGPERVETWKNLMANLHDKASDVWLYHMIGFSRVGPRLDWRPTLASNSSIVLEQIKFK